MHILMLGSGKGSWTMRGEQLGAALGARVRAQPTDADLRWADVVVLVKKFGALFAAQVQRVGTPIVWDALDCWAQPGENQADRSRALALLTHQIRVIKPALVIGATQAMAEACGGVYLPHHSWQGLTASPARATVSVVGYEGNPLYLGTWRAVLERACHARGWRFVVNPPDLSQVDIFVALREGLWDGWICREWKSGVKVVNAIAAGRPIIAHDTAAIRELQPACSAIATLGDLDAALDYWDSLTFRAAAAAHNATLAPAYTLAAVAAQYQTILASVRSKVPA